MRPTVEAFGGRTAVNGEFATGSSVAARVNVIKSSEGYQLKVKSSLGATLGA